MQEVKITYDKDKNKTKGCIVSKPKQEIIPEVVGLSKIELFFLVLFAISIGIGGCGLGFYFANNENRKAIADKMENKFTIQETEASLEQFYVIFGHFNKIEDAQIVSTKIQSKTGKICVLAPKNNLISLYLGPYTSKSLAENESQYVFTQTSIKGSIGNEF